MFRLLKQRLGGMVIKADKVIATVSWECGTHGAPDVGIKCVSGHGNSGRPWHEMRLGVLAGHC